VLVLSNLIKFVDVNSHNWSFKNGTFLALKNIAKKIDNFFGKELFLAIFAKFGTTWQPW